MDVNDRRNVYLPGLYFIDEYIDV